MVQTNYKRALANTLVYEGGYSNNPRDPGGPTMKGVTQRVYDAYRVSRGLAKQSVKGMSEAELQAIYANGYWTPVNGDCLPQGMDFVAFDGAVNSGPARGLGWVASALGVTATKDAVCAAAKAAKDQVAAIKKATAKRMGFLRGLRTFRSFGKGWARRVASVEAIAVKMALEAMNEPPAVVTAELVHQKDQALKKNTQSKTAAGGSAVAGGGGVVSSVDVSAGWDQWAIMSGFVLVILVMVAFFAWWARNHRERAQAYADLLAGKLEETWDRAWAKVQAELQSIRE